MCSVSRQAISTAIQRGNLTLSADGTIDPTYPPNRAYMEKHQYDRAVREATDDDDDAPAVAQQSGAKRKTRGKKKRSAPPPEDDEDWDGGGWDEDDDEDDESPYDVTPQTLLNNQKIREQITKIKIENSRALGQLIDRKIIESQVGALSQAVQTTLIDPQKKWANAICQMLGVMDRVPEVEEYLEQDVRRAIENISYSVEQIKDVEVDNLASGRSGKRGSGRNRERDGQLELREGDSDK